MNTEILYLKKYFGLASFRPGQEKMVQAILSGKDVLAIMPTGAGKSLCYQLPALTLPGCAIIISPLISLMEDQVASLIKKNISAAFISSTLSQSQISLIYKKALSGAYKLLYVSPERLQSRAFRELATRMRISFICVDEAHCISRWGNDFRPAYRKIPDIFETAGVPRVPIAAFTATADDIIRKDISDSLGLKNPVTTITGFDRPNLYFEVRHPPNKLSELEKILFEKRDECGIIYCLTRRHAKKLTDYLMSKGYDAACYHGGLSGDERTKIQEAFIKGQIRVVVATNAFGMGIDKSDVRYVIHFNTPANMENYYQEAGRAGRDQKEAVCILLYGRDDAFINLSLCREKTLAKKIGLPATPVPSNLDPRKHSLEASFLRTLSTLRLLLFPDQRQKKRMTILDTEYKKASFHDGLCLRTKVPSSLHAGIFR